MLHSSIIFGRDARISGTLLPVQEDLRLQVFNRFLTEEWAPPVLLAYVAAATMCVQLAGIACLEFPREAGRGLQYPWLDYGKAAWVADQVLGQRSGETRQRFLSMVSLEWRPAGQGGLLWCRGRLTLSWDPDNYPVRDCLELMLPVHVVKGWVWHRLHSLWDSAVRPDHVFC